MLDRVEFRQNVVQRSASGHPLFRPILMQFAAHHVGCTYRDFYLDHGNLVKANVACLRDFGMDAVGLISDPMREAEAFGAECHYPAEGVPHCSDPPVKTLEDIDALVTPDVMASERMRDRVDGARRLRAAVGENVPVIGWIEGPLAEACDLAGVTDVLLKLAMEPEFCHRLLAKLMPTAKAFAEAQVQAGCDIVGMGDAICSQISPQMYQQFVQPLHREIIDFIHDLGALVKVHICGDITHLLPHLREVDPDIVDIDHMVDMEHAYEVLGDDIIRCGNLDPAGVVEQKTAEEVASQTEALVRQERGRPFILSAGCEITPLTMPENLRAMREASGGSLHIS